MYVHIDPETLKRYPWLGVLIGGTGCLLMLWVVNGFWRERRALANQSAPVPVTVEEASLAPGVESRWIRLHGGRWLCDQALEDRRHPPESWLFGRVNSTLVPLLDGGGALRVVVKHDEEWPADACRQAGVRGLAGILTRAGERVWSSGIPPAFGTWPRRGELLVLHPAEGAPAAGRNALVAACLLVVFAVFAGYYAVLWSGQRETRIGPC